MIGWVLLVVLAATVFAILGRRRARRKAATHALGEIVGQAQYDGPAYRISMWKGFRI